MQRALGKLLYYGRHFGFRRTLYWVVHTSLNKLRLYRWLSVLITEIFSASLSALPQGRPLPQAFSQAFTIRTASEEDRSALQIFGTGPDLAVSRLREGNTCMLLLKDQQIQAVEWVAVGPSRYTEDQPELHCVFNLGQGSCWLFDGASKFQGAWGVLMKDLLTRLYQQGIGSAYCRIDYDNFPSLVSHRSLGYKRLATLVHVNFFGVWLTLGRHDAGSWERLPLRFNAFEISGDDLDRS